MQEAGAGCRETFTGRRDKEINMSDNEKLQKWLQEHDGEDYCKYCTYDLDCPHGVTGSPSGPSYLPCSDGDIIGLLDTERILADLEADEDGEN